MIILLVEGVITFIIIGALFYVAPSVLASVRSAAPIVYATTPVTTTYVNGTTDAVLNASVTTIGTTVVGGLNLSSITMIMLGIGLMVGGFMLVRGYR